MSLLNVSHLTVSTASGRDLVKDITFALDVGEKLGIIGESGSGKTLTSYAILGLLAENLHATGSATFAERELIGAPEKEIAPLRGDRISIVFQEPLTALNPLKRVGKQVDEVMLLHGTADKATAAQRTKDLFAECSLPERAYEAFPHELSGGQRQRALIAMAVANNPDLLICDEPTTALDVTVQQQIVDLISRLTEQRGTAVLFISHDIGLVSHVCDSLIVMKDGHLVEKGATSTLISSPAHPYTAGLVAATDLTARDENGEFYTVSTADTYVPGVKKGVSAAPTETATAVTETAETESAEAETAASTHGPAPIIVAENVSKVFTSKKLFHPAVENTALSDVSLTVTQGMQLGIVGESGSGKSTFLRLLSGLITPTSGTITLHGKPVDPRTVGRSVQMVFQDPRGSLDPRMTVGRSIAEPGDVSRARVEEVLAEVGLDPSAADKYPHEFSGGQRQRISIARALSVHPEVLLADEAVSALDVSVRAQILNLLQRLSREYGLTTVFVSHDLGVIHEICSDVAVFQGGRIVERGSSDAVYTNPQHAYTQQLLDSRLTLTTS